MKKLFLLLLSATMLLPAKSLYVSDIPLPKTYVQNLDPYACDERCLAELVSHEQVFSFLAHTAEPIEDTALNDQRQIYVSLFNVGSGERRGGVRIAMLLPEKVIGRYALTTANSVTAYLLGKNSNFELKTFPIGDESNEAIESGLHDIARENFRFVIAPLTKIGANRVAQFNPSFYVYFPTVNAQDVEWKSSRLFFGGIDYRAQIDLLMREAVPPLVIFYDVSPLGTQLMEESKTAFLMQFQDAGELMAAERQIYTYPIGKETTNLKSILDENMQIKYGTVVLNTPLVKSGMILSQLTLYEVNASNVLSTQINYDSLLFDITQPQDLEHLIVANSTGEQNEVLTETNSLLQNDIVFDWINYATTIGTDYFYHLMTDTPREYTLPFENNQVRYPVSLYRSEESRFEPYSRSAETFSIDSLFE